MNKTRVPPTPGLARKPRPLTDAEAARLRKDAGGYADPDALDALAERFAKPERDSRTEDESPDSNGWR